MNFTLKKAVILGCALIAMAMIVFNVVALFEKKEPTDILHMGSIKNFINAKAVIVRNETIIEAKTNGKLAPTLSEGTRVAKGETVAMLYNENSSDLLNKAEQAENKLMETIEKTLDDSTFENQTIKKFNNIIDGKIDGIISAEIVRNFNDAISFEKDIRFYTKEKINAIVNSLPKGSYLYQLKNEANKAREAFNNSAGCVLANNAGYISYVLDKKEKQISKLYNKSIKVNDVEKNYVENNTKPTKKVKAGSGLAKVITGFKQKLAFVIPEKDAASIVEGTYREVRINDLSITVKALVLEKSKPSNGKVAITLLLDRALGELSAFRVADIDFAKENYAKEGFKVPISVLFDWNKMTDAEGVEYETASIMVVKSHFSKKKRVKVLTKDEKYAIIDRLGIENETNVIELYDEYLLKPNDIQEGVLIY